MNEKFRIYGYLAGATKILRLVATPNALYLAFASQ
jgi:hypothetical protein